MCPGGGAFDSLFCPEGRVFVHNDCPRGGFLLPSSRVPGGGVLLPSSCVSGGMVMDEIATCIMRSEASLVLIKLSSREKFSNYKTCIMLRTIFRKTQNNHLELRSAVCFLAATRYQKLSMGLFNYLTLWIAIGWECGVECD